MSHRKPLVGGNWKMNTDRTTSADLTRGVVDALKVQTDAEVVVFPPFPYLLSVRAILRDRGSNIRLGAQDVYHKPDGAFTGEVSVSMLKDCGVQVVLAGHSERRHVIGETDEQVNAKVHAVLDAGLDCVLCVGETLEQREAGHTDPVNQRQVRAGLAEVTGDMIERVTIAYEPVWAIGTGKNANPSDAQDVHAKIRKLVAHLFNQDIAERMRIIYGGSLKPDNAAGIFNEPDVDGGLVGGASLKVEDFAGIVRAAAASRP
ncbi:MAG: triose-phosphate isomerase [Phycisphaeraceae bacterium]|nr:MAG: triose-phosphate isomerase [Phycisphaeraceae bacterium]